MGQNWRDPESINISDKELKKLIKEALKDGMSRHEFLMELRKKKIACGQPRLAKLWDICGGKIRFNINSYV